MDKKYRSECTKTRYFKWKIQFFRESGLCQHWYPNFLQLWSLFCNNNLLKMDVKWCWVGCLVFKSGKV